jgi:hypothetical protein
LGGGVLDMPGYPREALIDQFARAPACRRSADLDIRFATLGWRAVLDAAPGPGR